MSAEVAVQVAIRARLAASDAVVALVPVESIIDRNERPVPYPSIILGEDQTIEDSDSLARDRVRIFSTLHVWKREPSLVGVKAIAWVIRSAVHRDRLDLGTVFQCIDCRVSQQRFLRDPDGETSHGVVTVETLVRVLP